MPHVFISYAWADGSTLARRLHQSLNELDGWSAWMDTNLHADTVFSHALQGQIDRADVVVVVISPEVNRRDPPSFVQREMVYATQPGVDKPVFAVRATNCPVPLIIAGVTYQDFFGAVAYDDALAGLVEKIQRSPRRVSAASRRERELAYLRQVAQEHGFWGKVYVDTAAEARVRPAPDPAAAPAVPDPDIAAYLGEIVMAIHPEKGHSPDDDSARETVENFTALTDALARFERVVIIGDPGSGKTTTLRRFAYDLADKAALDENAPLPVFVPLGGYTGGDLGAYIARHLDGLRVDDYLPDRAVVLLDGLNETARDNVPAVQAWLDAHATARVMLTCRKLDYVERKLPLQRVDVLPLDLKRIRQFMTAYKLTEQQCDTLFWGLAGPELKGYWDNWQRAGRSFDDFWSSRYAMGATSGLLGLAQNPFLLTMTIGIFTTGGEVPRNRGELFTRFVKGLFEQRGKPAAEKAQIDWIDEQDQRHALADLAYQMQAERRGTRVPYAWTQNIVAKSIPKHDPDDLLYLAASSGIIEKGDQVRFVHQLLQEFFAAHGLDARMKLGIPARRYWPRKNWWESHGWEETAVLLAGLYHEDCTPVLEWLQKANPELAGRCVTESGAAIPTETLERLRSQWIRRMGHSYPLPWWLSRLFFFTLKPTLEARAAVGRGLADIGDPRPGVGRRRDGTPDLAWCEVPAGRFRMGGDPDAWGAWKGGEFKLDYPFWIARYPVTYAQYTAFVEAGGYRERRYWTEAGWRNKGDRMAPYLWNDPQWHIANHPVIGVTWYEAYAYTQWLDELRRQEKLKLPSGGPAKYVIRLPRECEWEKTARYPDGRKFSWGNEWDPTRLNSTDSGIGRTSAVGLFPQGANPAHGAYDLSGNVWEWLLTRWAEQYRLPETENNDPRGASVRCARGGSWYYQGSLCRAASRNRYRPYNWYLDWGFRVVVSVPI